MKTQAGGKEWGKPGENADRAIVDTPALLRGPISVLLRHTMISLLWHLLVLKITILGIRSYFLQK